MTSVVSKRFPVHNKFMVRIPNRVAMVPSPVNNSGCVSKAPTIERIHADLSVFVGRCMVANNRRRHLSVDLSLHTAHVNHIRAFSYQETHGVVHGHMVARSGIQPVAGLTAYLKFAKLQYVSSGFRCRVITGSLMRLY